LWCRCSQWLQSGCWIYTSVSLSLIIKGFDNQDLKF
jgi:hypothetical protein